MATTTAVGIRELKNKLSAYLREVRNGTRVLVLDRGEVIGILRAPRSREEQPRATGRRGRAVGREETSTRKRRPCPASPLGAPTGMAAALLDAERGE